MGCNCANDWRIELLDIETGERIRYVNPKSWSFEQALNETGSGSITLPIRAYTPSDIWPRTRQVAFTRIAGAGADPLNPICEWVGQVDDAQLDSGGDITLGLKHAETILANHLIRPTETYTGVDQTEIGATIVNNASTGTQITATFDASAYTRDRVYFANEDVIRLEAVQQLTQVINGPDYIVTHPAITGGWSTNLHFVDYAGDTTAKPLNARRGVSSYSLSVSTDEHANVLVGRGNGISNVQNQSAGSLYPPLWKSYQWSEIKDATRLQESVLGYLDANNHPRITPEITLADIDLTTTFDLGDTIGLVMGHGALRYDGEARLIRKAWTGAAGGPTSCAFTLTNLTDPVTAILNVGDIDPGCC